MAHKADYSLRLTIEDNNLVLIQYAEWKNHILDIVKYNFTENQCYIRWGNVDYYNLGGWLVQFPDEKVRLRYSYEKEIIKKCPYSKANKYEGLMYGKLLTTNEDYLRDIILQVHPEFKYLMKKIDFNSPTFTIFKLLDAMRMWYEHPSEVEALASKGFYKLLMNKNLYKLSKPKKKAIIQALNHFNGHIEYDLKLIDIQDYCNSGLSFEEWQDYRLWCGWYQSKKNRESIELYRYCKRKDITKAKYYDMLSMASSQGHDIEDEYWKYPNDPHAMHDRLLQVKQELERIRKEQELEKEKIYWKELPVIQNKVLKHPVDLGNGYMLFMPTTYEEYNKAAELLHQCILAAGYYRKVAKGQSLLFMIWKDGNPSSTLELSYDNKLLQFYDNEINRANCKPTEYEQEAIKQFLTTFKPKKLKEDIIDAI